MITRFNTLLTLEVDHEYYSGTCRDFDFFVPSETIRELSKNRLLSKVNEGRLYLLYECSETGIPIITGSETTIRIALRLNNPCFSNFTDFTKEYGSVLLYRNIFSKVLADLPLHVGLRPSTFTHPVTKKSRPVTVTLKSDEGRVLFMEAITAQHDREEVSLRLTDNKAGLYEIAETYGDMSVVTTSYYVDSELFAKGVTGIIEISLNSSFYPPSAVVHPAFSISFKARKEYLKYYVVMNNMADSEKLSISDTGSLPPIEFTKILSAAFDQNDIQPDLLLSDNTQSVILFKSTTRLVRQQLARKKIQLARNGDVLIAHLPQPAENRTSADIVIRIS